MNNRITVHNLNQQTAFKFAEADHVPELVALYERFYGEAVYKDYLELDLARVRQTVLDGIVADTRPHILALVDDQIVGFLSYFLDHSFSVKPCLVLQEFYVVPEFRKGAIGRALLAMSVHEGVNAGAGAYHAPVASGMTEARSLFNLFDKAGFVQFGYIMRRPL